jgi:molecular chaperone GrpE
MNVIPEWNSADGLDDTGPDDIEAGRADGEGFPPATTKAAEPPLTDMTVPLAGPPAALISEISVTVQKLADSSERYHARAEQRESVIDHLRSELDLLRRGERRGLLRPVLAEMCRLRDDLLKQAATLPADFDAAKAVGLLRSYAETIELTLESNGVVTYAPDSGDRFNPRMHRRVRGEPTTDPALAGHVAALSRDGYLDIEANSPIAPAEVSVYAVTKGEQEQ